MTAAAHQRTLTDVATDVALGVAPPEALHRAFLGATVYCERGARPGFRALGEPGRGVVPVYSSPEQLALARGTVEWLAMTGSELLTLLPVGYDLVLDIGGSAPLRLRPTALARQVVIEVARREDLA